ncbi:MAG: NUDIX hydrolase [Candidatus Marinimicrobia bacterium]|nr:NUDIX hydrolase [Candidatus Neomarinimicrobiota bacterium]MBL7022941.1 NUDIX hydrolase [Candidatus Neomarinimicrobiota bacterium]MBL7108759.1 NUDIX hydrolase [Candidatus Neomarinimicrobiota bacterium]
MAMAYMEYCSNCGEKNSEMFVEGRHRYYCNHCDTVHYENPKPTATLICPKGKEILLVRRKYEPAKGFWCLPGGFIELGETPQMAAIRELKEETNLNGNIEKLLGHCSHFNSLFGDVLLLGMVMKIEDFSIMQPGDDAEDVKLFPLNNLPVLAFRCHTEIVEMYRKEIS